jgi:hypothetical protein
MPKHKPKHSSAPCGNPEVTAEMISTRAYYLYIDRGRAPGLEEEDWLRAESELQSVLTERQDARP